MPTQILTQLTDAVQQRFQEARTILSFDEYLDLLYDNAPLHCRNSAQYIQNAFQHFGQSTVDTPLGEQSRFCIFNGQEGERHTQVVGQEEAQRHLYRQLSNFVRESAASRLILLHGPNGSGKSSMVQALIEALEAFSHTDDGMLYRFNWIFPAEKLKRGGIGFGRSGEEKESGEILSYAHLEGDQVEARIQSPLKDHPLLLLPHTERRQLFATLFEQEKLPRNYPLSRYLLEGDLSPRNRVIFDALLAHHNGDFRELLRHVQVERYYLSQRYRNSAVTVEPQMHVDASLRQVTADRSLAALPKPLNTINLFEPIGALVDANRGLLEFSDLLKRPVEAFKYLLGTCETGRVNVEPMILFLDLILVGTANEQNLDQFKKFPEFMSFKSRIELVRVPYLLRYSIEKIIYDDLLQRNTPPKPLTPHTTELAAMWAVLTRLKKPDKDRLPSVIADLVVDLSPLEKGQLYDSGTIPARFSAEEAKMLRQNLSDLYNESINDPDYEGRIGASPREIRTVLLNAAQNDEYPCLSPLALFDELENLVQERSVYRFLDRDPEDGYYDARGFIETIREEHLDIIDREFRTASGLIKAEQYVQLLDRYIRHVKAYLRKEKVKNPMTRASEDPDKKLMESVEEILLSPGEDTEQFRNDIIGKIAVHSLNNPSQPLDMSWLFSDYIKRLERNAFGKQYKRLRRLAEVCLILLMEENPKLKDNEKEEAQQAIKSMQETFGYSEEGTREQIALLMRQRYRNENSPTESE